MAKPMTVSRDVMNTLLDSKKPMTARELNASAVICHLLHKRGMLTVKGVQRVENRRGRPAFLYALTPDMRRRLNRQRKADAKATA